MAKMVQHICFQNSKQKNFQAKEKILYTGKQGNGILKTHDQRRLSPWHVIVKILEFQPKERILKAVKVIQNY